MTIEREKLEADVLVIGAGPAGLSCALHLANLIEQHTAAKKSPPLSTENIYVLEKAREIGAHQLSGAIMDPRGLRELVPDFEKSAPLDTPVTGDAAYVFTEKGAHKLPITPPPLANHGNYIVSLNKLVKWLGGLVEKKGINLFTQFAGRELIYENRGIAGVITEDKGVDKNGKPKDNFTPGYELRAKVTVLAEGPRGSLTKDLVARLKLDGLNPQVYGIGIKELWDVQPGRIDTGFVAHTLGWPFGSDLYGGGWIYGLRDNRVSIGTVVGLEYKNPLFDPHEAFQKFKTHPFVEKILEGGKLVRYGAKTVPYGGWYSMPRNEFDGGLIIGDSGSLLNSQRLKGIHTAIKSGMLAAEAIYDALCAGDTSAAKLAAYRTKLEQSWLKKELWAVRNFHQGFHGGLWKGLIHSGFQFVTGGRGLIDPMRTKPGYEDYAKLDRDGSLVDQSTRFKGDGKLTFDRLTDVYHSGTRHDEDQPCHLVVLEPSICGDRCVREFGNPCQYFCPAAVYELVTEKGAAKLKINAANCVHCKTCDIADPYQIIQWVPPEGGGGPNYEGM
ncbi:MAG TPA: electron transfer flavoprotein-ubiquinone oxidoreductase [Candidatus Acidoferrales bacterium]|nr:electron transfer flavoprotein-ubiquinone oxidoreductase [Candidatus Acidoferrales bacterium]